MNVDYNGASGGDTIDELEELDELERTDLHGSVKYGLEARARSIPTLFFCTQYSKHMTLGDNVGMARCYRDFRSFMPSGKE